LATAQASAVTTKVIDDFSSTDAPKTWSAGTQRTQVSYEHGALRLEMPKYEQGKAEDGSKIVRNAADLPLEKYNGLLIDVTNPTDHTQTLDVAFRDGKGRVAVLFYRVDPKQHRAIKAEFALTSSDYIDWTDVRSIELATGQATAPHDQIWLIQRVSAYCDDIDSTLLAQLEGKCREAREAFTTATSVEALKEPEASKAQETLKRWTDALRTHEGISGKEESCRLELEQVYVLSRVAALTKQYANTDAVLWSVPPGTRFESAGALAQFRQPLDQLSLYAAKGEYVDGLVRITNTSPTQQDWRITTEAKAAEDNGKLSIRRNQEVLAVDGSLMGDALIPLDDSEAISIAPGQSAELWVRADVKHQDWAPGTHDFGLHLMDLRRGYKSDKTVPIAVRIRAIDLNDAPRPLKVGLWTSLESPRSQPIVGEGREQTALDNLMDYGVNVLDFSYEAVPWPKLSPEGDLLAKPDYAAFDRAIQFQRSRGKPFFLFWLGMDTGKTENYGLHSGLTPQSPQWKKGLHNWLEDWTRHLRDLGLHTSDYAFYVTDEPDLDELDRTRAFGEIAKAIDPSIQIYADCSHVYDDPAMNDKIMAVTDIWQPDERMIKIRPDQWAVLKSYPGKYLWMYDCRVAMRQRHAGIYEYYRLLTWRALQNGLTGVSYWTYCQPASNEQAWDSSFTDASGAMLVYPGRGKSLIMSVRWELLRMALDDAKYYRLLQQATKAQLNSGLKDQIAAMLGSRFADVINHPNDPAQAVQWRLDAGAALESAAKTDD
jgi:hypothetical protein